MENLPVKIADFLESVAIKIRSMTVNRVRKIAQWAALSLVITALASLAIAFLLIGVFRILGELIGMGTTYAALGGLFALIGALLWGRRIRKQPTKEPKNE